MGQIGRVMHMYGVGKHRDEIAEKRVRRQLKINEKMSGARVKRVPKFTPGVRIGLVILVRRFYEQGYFGLLHRGRWVVLCDCGLEFIIERWRLYQNKLYSCGCVSRPRSEYKKPAHTRPNLPLAGMMFGKLKAKEFTSGKGWTAECQECQQEVRVRYSHQLPSAGNRHCCRVARPSLRRAGSGGRTGGRVRGSGKSR